MIWNIYKKEFAPTASFAQSFIKPNTVKLKFTYVVTELSHKDAGKQVAVWLLSFCTRMRCSSSKYLCVCKFQLAKR